MSENSKSDSLILHFKEIQFFSNFSFALSRTINSDEENFLVCSSEQLIQMEKMTSNRAYFYEQIAKPIIGNVKNTYLDIVFSEKDHVNSHSNKNRTPYEIFSKWPILFQEMFWSSLQNRNILELYESYWYGLNSLK